KPNVEFIGEISDAQKSEFLSRAIALIVPIDWPEPFGLVMIASMGCGAPVIAFNRGAVPELIEDGVTGFVVEDETSAVGSIRHLSRLSRTMIRERFEQRFTARRMARDYLAVTGICSAARRHARESYLERRARNTTRATSGMRHFGLSRFE